MVVKLMILEVKTIETTVSTKAHVYYNLIYIIGLWWCLATSHMIKYSIAKGIGNQDSP